MGAAPENVAALCNLALVRAVSGAFLPAQDLVLKAMRIAPESELVMRASDSIYKLAAQVRC